MVDLSYFNDCFDDDTALKIKVIQLFIHQSDEKIASFHMQLQRKNYTEIAQIAHFLQSSFITMGLPVNDLLTTIEHLALQEKEVERITEFFDQVEKIYHTAQKEYTLLLAELNQP